MGSGGSRPSARILESETNLGLSALHLFAKMSAPDEAQAKSKWGGRLLAAPGTAPEDQRDLAATYAVSALGLA
eukprot:1545355-Rhodomonas_salina.3